jgi:hypothetical protein
MLECRHLGEGMARQMRFLAMTTEPGIDELVRDTFLGECQASAPHMSAARRAIDDRPRHV